MSSRLRILDFDIENRPLAYLGPEYTTAEVTAIASCWIGEPDSMMVGLLGRDYLRDILRAFVKRYNAADMVTGHYIREHDLPIINGALLEVGLPALEPKMTSDTKIDLVAHKHLSASQENLAATFKIAKAKVHMSNADWREANRLTTKGIQKTYKRVVGDVIQHMALRKVLIERNLLGAPKVWRP